MFCTGRTTCEFADIKLRWDKFESNLYCSGIPPFYVLNLLFGIILGSLGLPEEGGAVVYHEAKVGEGRQRLQQAPGQMQIMHRALRQAGKGRWSKVVALARQG